jgi:inner membrane protein
MVAVSVPKLTTRDRSIIAISAVMPDLDGLGIIPEVLTRNWKHPLSWFSLYHHRLHNLAFALVIAVLAYAIAKHRLTTGLLSLLVFHLHLSEDLIGSRGPDGYQWPIPYLWPFSESAQLVWRGQWALNAWPNVLITVCLVFATLYLSWRKGFSPLEIFSGRADRAFVRALRNRFSLSRADSY